MTLDVFEVRQRLSCYKGHPWNNSDICSDIISSKMMKQLWREMEYHVTYLKPIFHKISSVEFSLICCWANCVRTTNCGHRDNVNQNYFQRNDRCLDLIYHIIILGGVAQMVERSLSMREVPGSIPGASSHYFRNRSIMISLWPWVR